MRKLALFLICLLLFSFFGCEENPNDATQSANPTDPTFLTLSTLEILDTYFDTAKTHYPREADIDKITFMMPVTEAVEILGKPHDFGPTSGVPSLSWVTDFGNEYYFVVMLSPEIEKPEHFDQMPYNQQLMECGMILSKPHKMGENQE